MDRRVSFLAACVAVLVAASGCQDYNFNPVGHCLVQPGTKRVKLSTVSTADVLFVVDDSGSMGGEQAGLAASFGSFMTGLNAANADRVASGLDPIDFHIAITSTSMAYTPLLSSTCSTGCSGTGGSKVCCLGGSNIPQAPSCRSDPDCGSGYVCRSDCAGATPIYGNLGCFRPDSSPDRCDPQPIPCTEVGAACTNVFHYYPTFTGCDPGYAPDLFTPEDEFPMGRFMADRSAGYVSDPLVLHFEKNLYCDWKFDAATGTYHCPPTSPGWPNTTQLTALENQFGANVKVGTCGSYQEQGLEAARAAVERARGRLGGQGPDFQLKDFLHDNSKLVVVWVTDEDDCSTPSDPARAVAYFDGNPDACRLDYYKDLADQREFAISAYADYFTSLGRPFAAAFIASYDETQCDETSCPFKKCCVTSCPEAGSNPWTCTWGGVCGGQSLPYRYQELATQLQGRGAEVLRGSVCADFGLPGGVLEKIADVVKPPAGLELPTVPAATDVTLLRIARSDGTTRKTCRGPAPAGTLLADALADYDWWFTATKDQATDLERAPTGVSKYVFIVNSVTDAGTAHNCDANAGETYSLDYIGQLPAESQTPPSTGCPPGDPNCQLGGCLDEAGCAAMLGGSAEDWTCFAGMAGGGLCADTNPARGTCICGGRDVNCPLNP